MPRKSKNTKNTKVFVKAKRESVVVKNDGIVNTNTTPETSSAVLENKE